MQQQQNGQAGAVEVTTPLGAAVMDEPEGPKHFLSADDILGADDRETIEVYVPEWKGYVCIGTMTATERDAFEDSCQVPVAGKPGETRTSNLDVRAKLMARVLLHPQTKQRLFTDAQVAALGQKSSKVMAELFTIALHRNGFTEKKVEQLAGNSASGRGAASSSLSH